MGCHVHLTTACLDYQNCCGIGHLKRVCARGRVAASIVTNELQNAIYQELHRIGCVASGRGITGYLKLEGASVLRQIETPL